MAHFFASSDDGYGTIRMASSSSSKTILPPKLAQSRSRESITSGDSNESGSSLCSMVFNTLQTNTSTASIPAFLAHLKKNGAETLKSMESAPGMNAVMATLKAASDQDGVIQADQFTEFTEDELAQILALLDYQEAAEVAKVCEEYAEAIEVLSAALNIRASAPELPPPPPRAA